VTQDNSDDSDHAPEPAEVASDILLEANAARESLKRGTPADEVEDAIHRLEGAVNDAARQLEEANDALLTLTGGGYGDSVADTYDGVREAQQNLEAVRALAGELEDRDTDDDGDVSGTLTVHGQEFEVSLSPADGDDDTDGDDDGTPSLIG